MSENSPTSPSSDSSLNRRNVLQGAAWSVPVIAMAAASPAFAASPCSSAGMVPFVPRASPFELVEIPIGTRSVSYTVRGAGGGRAATSGALPIPGSQGAVATGRFYFSSALVSPLTLRVYVGHGGAVVAGGGVATGGAGFGAGGDSTSARPASTNQAAAPTGGGGGASAITLGNATTAGAPIIVAGGGGGGGIAEFITTSNTVAADNTKQVTVLTSPFQGLQYGRGDAFAAPNSRGSGMSGQNESVTTFSVSPAFGASGATGGAAGGASSYSTASWNSVTRNVGSVGGNYNSATFLGGRGGNGAAPIVAVSGRTMSASAGGGGGGYAGGGGGGIARGRFVSPGSSGTTQSTSSAVSTGGAGSSFVITTALSAGGRTITVPPAENLFATSNLNPTATAGHPGSVTVTFCR